ncbi:chorismate-binding protein [Saccharopolyspora sp. NPDC050389]|uniref:isochorismate synthase n=1 Tax=Saccharopolyspora sp. NPDC050389 TaxID=3155516 RepID=UPI0033C2103D
MTTTVPEREIVSIRDLDAEVELCELVPTRHGVLSWLRGGDGLVGWGEAARFEISGPDRFGQAAEAWARFVERIGGDPRVAAFVSFSYAGNGRSVLIVPRVLVGRRAGRSWITTIGPDPRIPAAPVTGPGPVRWRDGDLPSARWRDAAAEAVRRIRRGEFEKVVLARDLVAEAAEPIDPRHLVRELAARHPDCWTFAVAGLVGATPEMLLRRDGNRLTARVLAGTSWDDGVQLARSRTHLSEHAYAVASLVGAIAPNCTTLRTDGPFELRLRDIAHLATDVAGELKGDLDLFALAAAVHPTAAVGGTPRAAADRVINELEGLDRGRYAGPVGWIDATGSGELGIALRCAQLTGPRARLFAGCGLIAESDPDVELRETEAKFAALCEVLGA